MMENQPRDAKAIGAWDEWWAAVTGTTLHRMSFTRMEPHVWSLFCGFATSGGERRGVKVIADNPMECLEAMWRLVRRKGWLGATFRDRYA